MPFVMPSSALTSSATSQDASAAGRLILPSASSAFPSAFPLSSRLVSSSAAAFNASAAASSTTTTGSVDADARVSIIFAIADQPGLLLRALEPFSRYRFLRRVLLIVMDRKRRELLAENAYMEHIAGGLSLTPCSGCVQGTFTAVLPTFDFIFLATPPSSPSDLFWPNFRHHSHGVNLSHIESRPSKPVSKRGEGSAALASSSSAAPTFDFFVDVEGRVEEPRIQVRCLSVLTLYTMYVCHCTVL